MKKILATTLIASLLMMFFPLVASASGYSYQRIITINSATYNPATATNFTVLVCANGASPCSTSVSGLNQSGGGAHVQNSSGYDIVFSSTVCTSPTLMKWEMEDYVASTGEMEAWVLIPSLTTSNQTIYMCYGNSGISTFQGGALGSAWDANYQVIYHVPNGSTISSNDSTSNALNAANTAVTATTGQIDGGGSFNGSTSGLGPVNLVSAVTSYTFSAWLKLSASPTGFGMVIQQSASGIRFKANGITPEFLDGPAGIDISDPSSLSTGTWTYYVGTYDGTNATMYINGSSVVTGTGGATSHQNTFYFGQRIDGFNFAGSLDEFRVSSIVRSANWITTEYNNQSAPNTFETFGTETAVSVPVVGAAVLIIREFLSIRHYFVIK